ncbi:hypothetical protein Cadr_000019260 [Camelus dromedarius]|uniref:Uncharacterized protein n=1 Tax=Camelus dromedarius TaxID=9838 RepID=A0A5N4D1B8_CAMDR|nr:hypothetical protein Cadr_000019260 [Camelus dromedarius]
MVSLGPLPPAPALKDSDACGNSCCQEYQPEVYELFSRPLERFCRKCRKPEQDPDGSRGDTGTAFRRSPREGDSEARTGPASHGAPLPTVHPEEYARVHRGIDNPAF